MGIIRGRWNPLFHYGLLKTHGHELAASIIGTFIPEISEIDTEIIKKAMKFRFSHKKQKLSTADCVGYVLARENDLKFLTGDKEFEGFPNVCFVK